MIQVSIGYFGFLCFPFVVEKNPIYA